MNKLIIIAALLPTATFANPYLNWNSSQQERNAYSQQQDYQSQQRQQDYQYQQQQYQQQQRQIENSFQEQRQLQELSRALRGY